ncbi:hypothetical protein FSOLCH5_006760 [Fusarium solani]
MEEKHRFDWPRYVHRARWTCPRCPEEPEKAYFPTEAALARHLSEDATASHHPGLDAMEISRITAGCKEFNPIGEDDCPLCGPPPWQEEWKPEKKVAADVSEKPGNEGNLSAHFASHLRYLAFQSLRWWDVDINGEEDKPARSQDAAGVNSQGSAGTTTRGDFTAFNIDLDGEELKALQESRARAEEDELLEMALDVEINREEDEPAPSELATGFNSEGSAGTATHEDSTAVNINLDDEQLKALQESRTHAEEEERLEREKHIPTSATETATYEDSTAANVDLDGEELKALEDSQAKAEGEELLEHILTSVTNAASSSIPAPANMEPTEVVDDTTDDTVDLDLDLRDKIYDALQENNEGKEFIPADAIACLASRDAVEAELMGKARHDRLARLVNYIFNKPAIKVFLILIFCNNVGAMAELSASGFGDQHLPLDEQIITKDGKRRRQVQSLSQLSDPGPVLEPLRSWRAADRRYFLEKQVRLMGAYLVRSKRSRYTRHIKKFFHRKMGSPYASP